MERETSLFHGNLHHTWGPKLPSCVIESGMPQHKAKTMRSVKQTSLNCSNVDLISNERHLFLIVMNFHDSFSLQTLTIRSDGELSLLHTIFDLNPYTKYTFFIQCSFAECLNGWGALSGPVTGMTKEEGEESSQRIFCYYLISLALLAVPFG